MTEIYLLIGFVYMLSVVRVSKNINWDSNIDIIASFVSVLLLVIIWPVFIIWGFLSENL